MLASVAVLAIARGGGLRFPRIGGYLLAIAVAAAAGAPLGAQSPEAAAFLRELDAIAQRQLKARATAIAAIKDSPSAEARQGAVRQRVLSLIGGLPDYHGPLRRAGDEDDAP